MEWEVGKYKKEGAQLHFPCTCMRLSAVWFGGQMQAQVNEAKRPAATSFPARTPARLKKPATGWALLIPTATLVCLYLYLQTFTLPHVPVLQRDDQITFVVNAVRMLRGEMIYKDFYQYTPPGTDLIYLALFKMFGVRAWIASAVVFLLGIGAFWICYAIAARMMTRASACLAAAMFTVLVFGSMLNGTHHWYSALLIMCAALCLLARRTRARLASAGAMVALASFFTQTRALSLVALLVFVAWESRKRRAGWREALKREASLLAGFACSFVLLNLYYLRHAGTAAMFNHQVVALSRFAFTLNSYLLGFPSVPPWYLAGRAAGFVLVYLLVPASYICGCAWLIRKRGLNYSAQDERILLLALLGIALFLEVLPAPNWVRLFPISMPAIILAVQLVAGEGTFRLFIRRSLWAGTAIVALLAVISAQTRPRHRVALPIGRATVYGDDTAVKLTELARRTKPGDYFFQAAWLDLYFPLQLRNPSYVEALSPSATPAQVEDVIRALEEHQVRYVLWSARLDAGSPGSSGLQPMRTYLKEHYRVVERFAPAEDLWERTTGQAAKLRPAQEP